MSGAAAILLKLGVSVSGSDLSPFDGLGILVGQGACVQVGHDEDHLNKNTDLVVISAAVPESNPELAAARRHGIPVIKYAQLLGELMRLLHLQLPVLIYLICQIKVYNIH